jgi:PTS system N-acetylglucosamine-specific IIB component
LELAAKLLQRLGGAANVTLLEPCLSRVRTTVVNPALVDVPALRALGAYGVVISGHIIQVVIGADTAVLVREMEKLISQIGSPQGATV